MLGCCRFGIHDRDETEWCRRCKALLPQWSYGWRWRDWRLWYWNIYYDGNHRVVQIGPLQIEFYS